MKTCGPVTEEHGRHECHSPPASGNVHLCPLHEAAPALLAALKDLVPLIAAEYPQQQETWLANARAAIAQAEGRIP
jgi:hypothetical protein